MSKKIGVGLGQLSQSTGKILVAAVGGLGHLYQPTSKLLTCSYKFEWTIFLALGHYIRGILLQYLKC